ncbi:MAG: cysteine--tRNA ligase [Phycisphaeraceae bacterium]|nr:cysteine--tRNA ligase [Phycisphaeraceae bacterium]
MLTVRITNTLTRQLEPIVPLGGPGAPLLFYSCGPTVYDDAHVGNFRAFLNADMLRRTLELAGHRVRHVMNITDVGHMTDDSNADGGGEDKMAVAGRRLAEAKKSGTLPAGVEIDPRDPLAIADFYAARFLEDAKRLGLKVALESERDPSLMPRPTRLIPEMVALVERLIERGHAYVGRDGVVYFDVRSFPEYGRLSGNSLDALREGAGERISAEHQANKKHPADFMLWKPDASHLMRWPSPWGEGYPGWHLECSVMAAALLGEEIDIHSGGEDNIFPHHECEIAQSRCAFDRPSFSRTWFHTRHLFVEGEKMSKSRGNFFTARDIFAKGATPAALRLEITRAHYRINSNFTIQGLSDCQKQIDRWWRVATQLAERAGVPAEAAADEGGLPHAAKVEAAAKQAGGPGFNAPVAQSVANAAGPIERALPGFAMALAEDLNVAKALAALNEAVGDGAALAAAHPARELLALRRMDSVLGVFDRNQPVRREAGAASGGAADPLDTKVAELLAARTQARASKNFAESDRIRDELLALGVAIKDGPQGTTWTRIVR